MIRNILVALVMLFPVSLLAESFPPTPQNKFRLEQASCLGVLTGTAGLMGPESTAEEKRVLQIYWHP